MKLLDDLKKKTKNGRTKEEAKELIKDTLKDAGKAISDDELDAVTGGGAFYTLDPETLCK